MICRLRGHIPMSYGPDLQGNDTIICNRCGKSPDVWASPIVGARTRAALWTCLGTGVATYAATDVAVLGTERALQVAVIAALAALCTRFGESKVGA